MGKCSDCRYIGECSAQSCALPEYGCKDYKSDKKTMNKPKKVNSICWKCSRLDCSWILKSEPVAGWEAELTNGSKQRLHG